MSKGPNIKWNRPWIWLWIAIGVAFLVVEFLAIANDEDGDTLSEQVWALMSWSSFIAFAVVGLLVWLIYHFVWEGRKRK